MTNEQALQNLENIVKAWLGNLGDNYTFEKAYLAKQSLEIVAGALLAKPVAEENDKKGIDALPEATKPADNGKPA